MAPFSRRLSFDSSGRYGEHSGANPLMDLGNHPGVYPHLLEVIFYGVEGEGTLVIGDEERPFKKGDLIFCKGEVPVGPKNTGRERFMVLVILVLKQLVSKS